MKTRLLWKLEARLPDIIPEYSLGHYIVLEDMDKEDAIVRDETRVTHYKSSRKALKSTLFGLFTLISTTTLFMLKSSQSSSHVSAVQAATDPLRYAPLDVDFVADFYSSVHSHGSDGLCVGMYGKSVSHSGYIGLKGDSTDSPKRSFFWYVY